MSDGKQLTDEDTGVLKLLENLEILGVVAISLEWVAGYIGYF